MAFIFGLFGGLVIIKMHGGSEVGLVYIKLDDLAKLAEMFEQSGSSEQDGWHLLANDGLDGHDFLL